MDYASSGLDLPRGVTRSFRFKTVPIVNKDFWKQCKIKIKLVRPTNNCCSRIMQISSFGYTPQTIALVHVCVDLLSLFHRFPRKISRPLKMLIIGLKSCNIVSRLKNNIANEIAKICDKACAFKQKIKTQQQQNKTIKQNPLPEPVIEPRTSGTTESTESNDCSQAI